MVIVVVRTEDQVTSGEGTLDNCDLLLVEVEGITILAHGEVGLSHEGTTFACFAVLCDLNLEQDDVQSIRCSDRED